MVSVCGICASMLIVKTYLDSRRHDIRPFFILFPVVFDGSLEEFAAANPSSGVASHHSGGLGHIKYSEGVGCCSRLKSRKRRLTQKVELGEVEKISIALYIS